MTDEVVKTDEPDPPRQQGQWPPPGLVAISLYMFVLAGFIIVGVVRGSVPPLYLVLSAAFIAASGGLMMLFRWAWALVLAAVVLLAARFLIVFAHERDVPSFAQGLLNLVFFLYLVRPEIRERLR